MQQAFRGRNWLVVDARDAHLHQSVGIERPVLIAVRAEPLPGVVVPFVSEAHGDAAPVVRPQLLDQAVVELPCPLALQEGLDGVMPDRKLGAIAPHAVPRVGLHHALRVARIPGIFREAHLLGGGFVRERRQGRSRSTCSVHQISNSTRSLPAAGRAQHNSASPAAGVQAVASAIGHRAGAQRRETGPAVSGTTGEGRRKSLALSECEQAAVGGCPHGCLTAAPEKPR